MPAHFDSHSIKERDVPITDTTNAMVNPMAFVMFHFKSWNFLELSCESHQSWIAV